MNGLDSVGGTMEAQRLRTRLAEKYQLPISPTLFRQLLDLDKDGGASLGDYAKLISTSSALSVKVLATVNSSWAGVRNSINRVSQAVNLLGTASTRTLVLAQCLASVHENVSLPQKIVQQYWQAGLFKATAAKVLVSKTKPEMADRAFLTALLQDMAVPLMHELASELYNHIIPRRARSQRQVCALESETFGRDHSWASLAIAEQMGVPPVLCVGIADHHDRNALRATCESETLADALYWASLFPHTSRWWRKDDAAAAASMVAERISGPTDTFQETVEQVLSEFWELAELVCPGQDTVNMADLLRQASGELVDRTTGLVCQLNTPNAAAEGATVAVSPSSADPAGLRDQGYHDDLTGVLSRSGVQTIGAAQLTGAVAAGQSVAVILLDIDNLASIHESLGRGHADQAVQTVAETLVLEFGSDATIGRWGPDEFLVIVCGPDSLACVKAKAAEVQSSLRRRPVGAAGGAVVQVSISGVWSPCGAGDLTLGDLISAANEVMRHAKDQPGGEVRIVRHVPPRQPGEGQ